VSRRKKSKVRTAVAEVRRPEEPAALRLAGRPHLLAAAGLILVTLLAYSNSFRAGFAMDNRGLLLEDPRIRLSTRANVSDILQHTYWWPYGESGLYRPVTTLSYLFNYSILENGERPLGYHVVNFSLQDRKSVV
jgi:hypothetical protein